MLARIVQGDANIITFQLKLQFQFWAAVRGFWVKGLSCMLPEGNRQQSTGNRQHAKRISKPEKSNLNMSLINHYCFNQFLGREKVLFSLIFEIDFASLSPPKAFTWK